MIENPFFLREAGYLSAQESVKLPDGYVSSEGGTVCVSMLSSTWPSSLTPHRPYRLLFHCETGDGWGSFITHHSSPLHCPCLLVSLQI